MRRDKDDEQWQEVKRKVFEIDKGQCLLCASVRQRGLSPLPREQAARQLDTDGHAD